MQEGEGLNAGGEGMNAGGGGGGGGDECRVVLNPLN